MPSAKSRTRCVSADTPALPVSVWVWDLSAAMTSSSPSPKFPFNWRVLDPSANVCSRFTLPDVPTSALRLCVLVPSEFSTDVSAADAVPVIFVVRLPSARFTVCVRPASPLSFPLMVCVLLPSAAIASWSPPSRRPLRFVSICPSETVFMRSRCKSMAPFTSIK